MSQHSLFLLICVLISVCQGYLQFLSQSSRATVSDITKINDIDNCSFSMSMWLRADYPFTQSSSYALISTRPSMGYQAFMIAFSGAWSTYTGFRPFIQTKYNMMSYTSDTWYTDGNWQHLVITRDVMQNGTCYLKYYMNATEIYQYGPTTALACSDSIYHANGALWIGDDVATKGWVGDIAEVSIWNRSLSSNEINEVYNNIALNQNYLSFEGLLHYYPLNESYQSCVDDGIIYDIWSQNHGVLSGTYDPLCKGHDFPTSDPSNHPVTDPTIEPSYDPTTDPIAHPTENPVIDGEVGDIESDGIDQKLQGSNDPNKFNLMDNTLFIILLTSVANMLLCTCCILICWRCRKSRGKIAKDITEMGDNEGISDATEVTAEGATSFNHTGPIACGVPTHGMPTIGMTTVQSMSSHGIATEHHKNTEECKSVDDDIYEDRLNKMNSNANSVVMTPNGPQSMSTAGAFFQEAINTKNEQETDGDDDDMYEENGDMNALPMVNVHKTESGGDEYKTQGDYGDDIGGYMTPDQSDQEENEKIELIKEETHSSSQKQ